MRLGRNEFWTVVDDDNFFTPWLMYESREAAKNELRRWKTYADNNGRPRIVKVRCVVVKAKP